MAFLSTLVLDNGLNALTFFDGANELHICDTEPSEFADVATMTLGVAENVSISAPADASPSGRKVTVGAVTDGDVTDTGTATHWALVDPVGEELLAAAPLTASQGVTSGNIWSSPAADITLPAAA